MPEHEQGTFHCPGCNQQYEVPPVTVTQIVAHMGRHGEDSWDARKVRRHLVPPEEDE